jgi:hypothetical protein
MTRCQICSRRRGLNKAGGMLAHYVRGLPCPGTGFPPVEQSDQRLETFLAEIRAEAEAAGAEISAAIAARANRIEPELIERSLVTDRLLRRLERRLARHRGWPARFRREMERSGYGSPPPAYLLARAEASA